MEDSTKVGAVIKSLLKGIFSLDKLPSSLRKRISRSRLNVDLDLVINRKITMKVADTEDELLQAYALAQKCCKKVKNVDQVKSFQLTKFHLLPTTKVLIAKNKNKVIASVVQVMDTAMGLPIDELFSINDIRKNKVRVCEMFSLAVDPMWRSESQNIFIPFLLYAIGYSRYVTGSDELVMTSSKEERYIYEDIFLFNLISNKSQIFAHHLSLSNIENRLVKTYYRYPENKNIYSMFANPKWEQNLIRDVHSFKIVPILKLSDQVLGNLLRIFNKKSTLSDGDKQVLYNQLSLYNKKYEAKNIFNPKRKYPRYYTTMKADIEIDSEVYQAECIEISCGGASFKFPQALPTDKIIYKIIVYLNSHESCTFMGKISWKSRSKIGFEADMNSTTRWEEYINHIEHDLLAQEQPSFYSA